MSTKLKRIATVWGSERFVKIICKKETQEIILSLLMLVVINRDCEDFLRFVFNYLSSCLSSTLSIKPYSTARGADMKLSRSVSA